VGERHSISIRCEPPRAGAGRSLPQYEHAPALPASHRIGERRIGQPVGGPATAPLRRPRAEAAGTGFGTSNQFSGKEPLPDSAGPGGLRRRGETAGQIAPGTLGRARRCKLGFVDVLRLEGEAAPPVMGCGGLVSYIRYSVRYSGRCRPRHRCERSRSEPAPRSGERSESGPEVRIQTSGRFGAQEERVRMWGETGWMSNMPRIGVRAKPCFSRGRPRDIRSRGPRLPAGSSGPVARVERSTRAQERIGVNRVR